MTEAERAFLDTYDVIARRDGVLDDEVANRWRALYDDLRLKDQPPPERRCSRCGATEDDTDEMEWPGLIDVRVVTAEGEEGYGDVTQLLCANCFPTVQGALHELGFKHHHHGGANFLEDEGCPGAGHMIGGVCPFPQDADFDQYEGTIVIQPR